MEDSLTRLVQAQRVEERLVALKRRADALPIEFSERAAQLSASAAEADQVDAERRAALARAQDLENDVRQREARVARLEEQIRNSRDAAATKVAEHEAAELRARSAEAQDQALSLLERAESLAARAAELRARLAESRADLERFRATVESDERALREEIEAHGAQRDALLAAFEPELREHFAALGRHAPGKVVAPLKSESCGGCGTRLTPNDSVRVRAKKTFFRCPSCARFLVAAEIWAAGERQGTAGA